MSVCVDEFKCPRRPEVINSLELELRAVVSYLKWVLGMKLCQEKYLLLTTEPSL